MATKDEIIAAAQEIAGPGGDVRAVLLDYAQKNNIPFEQVDQVLELPSGATAAYANRAALTQYTPDQIVAEAKAMTPEGGNYQQTLLSEATKAGYSPDQMDVILGLPAGSSAAYASRSALTQYTPDQIKEEAQKRTPEGQDVRDTLLQYIKDNNISFDQADILLGLPAGSSSQYAASKEAAAGAGAGTGAGFTDVINNLTGATTRSMLTSGGVPIKQTLTPLTQASPGAVPTLRPQPTQGVDQPGMMSRGFQSPVPSDISSLFNAVQDVRNVNQGYLSAPRTDLRTMRSSIESNLAAQDAAALEAQKKSLANQEAFYRGTSSGDYTGLTPQQIAFLKNETPAERDQRMYTIDNLLSSGLITSFAKGLTTNTTNDSGYPSVQNPGDYGNSPF